MIIPKLENYTMSDLYTLFVTTSRNIEAILSASPYNYNLSISYDYHAETREFIRLIHQLERLFYIDDLDKENTSNVLYKNTDFSSMIHYLNSTESEENKPIFLINTSPRTRYDETRLAREGLTHLEAAETTLKDHDNNQFLKIYTFRKGLYVYTNKQPSLKTVIQLKLLQWSIFKDQIKTPVKEVTLLLQALIAKDIETINETIKAISKLPILSTIRYNELKEMFKPDYKAQKNRLIDQKNQKEQMYIEYENKLSELITQINTLNENILDMELKEDKIEDNTPLIKYLSNHPYIKDIQKKNSRQVSLYFEAPILYFDDYIIEKLLPNKSGDDKRILKAFLDNKYELMTRCLINFRPSDFAVSLDYVGSDNFIGHPHIDRYSCFGNHSTAIREAAATANYFGAIEQISQAVLNINFTDSCVVNEMLRTLRRESFRKTWRSKETQVLLSTDEILEIYNE